MENENWGHIEGSQINDTPGYSGELDTTLNRAPFEGFPTYETLDPEGFNDTSDDLSENEINLEQTPFKGFPNERTESRESLKDDRAERSDGPEKNGSRLPYENFRDEASAQQRIEKTLRGNIDSGDQAIEGENVTKDNLMADERQIPPKMVPNVEVGQEMAPKPRNVKDSINDSESGGKLEPITETENIGESETIQKVNDSHKELENKENDHGSKPFGHFPGDIPNQNETQLTQKGKENNLEEIGGEEKTEPNKMLEPFSNDDVGKDGSNNIETVKETIQEEFSEDSKDTILSNTDHQPLKENENIEDAKRNEFTDKHHESQEIGEQNRDVDSEKEKEQTDVDATDRNGINNGIQDDSSEMENTVETGDGTESKHDSELNDQSQERSEENGHLNKPGNKKNDGFNFLTIKEFLSKKINDPKFKESIRRSLDKYGWLWEKNKAFPIYRREMKKRIVELSDFTTENLVNIIDSILNTVNDLDHKKEKKQYNSLKDKVMKKRRDPNSTFTLEQGGKGNKPRLREYKRAAGSNIFTSFGEGISDTAKRASSQNMKRVGTHPLFTGAKIQTHSGRDFKNRNIAYDYQQDYMKIPVELASDPKKVVPTLCKGIGYRAVNRKSHHDNPFTELLEHQKLSLNEQQWSEFGNAVDPIWEIRNGAQVPKDLSEFENVLGKKSPYSRQRFNEEMFALGSSLMLRDDVAADQPKITDRDKLFFVVRELMKYIYNRLRNKDPRSKLEFMKDLYKNGKNI
ncbi:hypothetical protein [Peribacillus sp. FSL R5-0717]|uniref:hypothetical protein n=1 Tax=Peribacillus sp. FSL R5-0717 TaxID=2975308 RepID=UPI0030F5FEA8